MRIVLFAIIAVLGTVFLASTQAYAWGPSTHLYLGREVIGQASLLGPYLEAMLSSNPLDFLYGSVFADMSLGKKFLHFAKFAHNWRIGFAMKDAAETDAQRACAWGYLAHLAADTVSHNEFVPRKIVEHYDLLGRGHIFFEGRFDSMLPDKDIHKMSKEVVKTGAANNDAFLSKIITRTMFSFSTNRRLFRGLLVIHSSDGIQSYRRNRAVSRNHLSPAEVKEYLERSRIAVLDFLEHTRSAECYAQDPHGKLAIKQATRLRSKLRISKDAPRILKDALEIVAAGPPRS